MAFRKLCIAILILLPFTKTLTLPVGFSLKIYEILVPMAFAAALFEGPLDTGRNSGFLRVWLTFLFVSLFSTAWGFSLILETDISHIEWARGRFHPLANATFHTVYLALDLMALATFLVCLNRKTLSVRGFARYWLMGAMIAVGYAVALTLVHLAGLPHWLLMRFTPIQTIGFAGLEIVRSGPFEEGNYLGLYLVLTLVLALWASARYEDRFFKACVPWIALGVFISASPAAIVSMIALLIVFSLRPGIDPRIRAINALAGLVVVVAIVRTSLFQELVLEKFSLILYGGIVDYGNISLVRRINESYHAWMIFRDHPWGVGIGNFGFFWGDHPELYPTLEIAYTTKKQIPNNVFLEILSEQGIQGLVLFLFSLGSLTAPLLRRREVFLAMGVLATCLYFFVFPTFRLLFLWVFWAFLVYVGTEPEPGSRTTETL